jgi:Zn-dependent membrane protease YugP
MSPDYLAYMVIGGITSLIGMVISKRLQAKMSKYSEYGLHANLSGRQVAEAMLRHFGIFDVQIVSQPGFLTDHYNPADKTVNLSEAVYNQYSITAAAVAAHEVGHAVQHATQYSMLQMRSSIVPLVKIFSGINQFLLPLALYMAGQVPQLMLVCIIGLAVTTAFALITLPVEFDASRRAVVWLEESNTCSPEELVYVKDGLKWAAMTYVASALSSLVLLLFLILRYMGSNR